MKIVSLFIVTCVFTAALAVPVTKTIPWLSIVGRFEKNAGVECFQSCFKSKPLAFDLLVVKFQEKGKLINLTNAGKEFDAVIEDTLNWDSFTVNKLLEKVFPVLRDMISVDSTTNHSSNIYFS
ncbi:unnamed protein product [Allacma fusca]|uniref:Uncharacterized protein n=1 Tax=Allacma fusca TaxID=39272 RepID=A0A8J2JZX0_9HEXA|nr:unnamed protein product [Allacma fusca]